MGLDFQLMLDKWHMIPSSPSKNEENSMEAWYRYPLLDAFPQITKSNQVMGTSTFT